jgi:hypothetical protein
MIRTMIFTMISASLFVNSVLAADSDVQYDYLFVLPLQYNYYQPINPKTIGQGNGIDFAQGAAAVFGNPARIRNRSKYQISLSSSNLSGGRSSLTIYTNSSRALPSAFGGTYQFNANNHLALGYRRAMNTGISFPDVINPEEIDRAEVKVDQFAAGWALSAIENFNLGVSLILNRFSFRWDGQEMALAEGHGFTPNYAVGIMVDLEQDFFFSAGFRSRTRFSCYTIFNGDTTDNRLKLAGTMPPIGWASLSYRPEDDFEVYVAMEMTSWHLVSSGYLEQTDYHLGCRFELIPGRIEAIAGSYSLRHPLDPFLRRNDAHLQNLYFISGGLIYSLGHVSAIFSGATSYPLSGKGLNQNILSAGIEYSR